MPTHDPKYTSEGIGTHDDTHSLPVTMIFMHACYRDPCQIDQDNTRDEANQSHMNNYISPSEACMNIKIRPFCNPAMGLHERLVFVLIVRQRLRRTAVLILLLRRRYVPQCFSVSSSYSPASTKLAITLCSYSSRLFDTVCPTPNVGLSLFFEYRTRLISTDFWFRGPLRHGITRYQHQSTR